MSQPPPAPVGGKKTKKAVIAPTIPDDPLLEVILHDTVIFPEGGGQPTDTGIITATDGTDWEVVQCKRHGGHAVHYVRVPNGAVDAALLAFTPGAKVTAALGKEGFDRRYDHVCRCFIASSQGKSEAECRYLDVYAHIATPAICPPRNATQLTHVVLVLDKLPLTLLC